MSTIIRADASGSLEAISHEAAKIGDEHATVSIVQSGIGNISENVVGVQLALQNDMDFSMVISLGASLQVALFVAPLLVFLALVVGHPMNLVFTPLELVTVGFGALVVAIMITIVVVIVTWRSLRWTILRPRCRTSNC